VPVWSVRQILTTARQWAGFATQVGHVPLARMFLEYLAVVIGKDDIGRNTDNGDQNETGFIMCFYWFEFIERMKINRF
jgi:hypothetical protein